MLGSAADVRPNERRIALAAFASLAGIFGGHALLETARDALFLSRLPASQLPWVYLAMAGVAVGLAQIPSRRLRGLTGRSGLSWLLVACGLVSLAFWPLARHRDPWALRALYVWTGVVGTLAGVQFWLVLGELFTITQAKRVYRLIGTGSLAGAAAGAGLARIVSPLLGAESLIPVAAASLLATGLGPSLLLRRPRRAVAETVSGRWTLAEAAVLLRQPYATRLAGLMLVSTVAVTLADYVFKSAVARSVPAEQLGPFFASVYLALSLLALAVQLLLMGWLLRTLGLHRALWVLPALLLVGAAGVVLGGGLLAALVLKGADGSLRPSLHRTGSELLFLPLPDSLRSRVKPVIDVLGQRGGQAVASLLILSELTLQRGDAVLATAAGALCVVWIAVASELRPHYVELFRAALREGTIETRGELPELDLGSLEALFAALNSQDDAEVVAALDLLAQEGRLRLVPALVLYHPSMAVVLRALELFESSGRTDFVPIADRLLSHDDPELRAAALRARTAAQPDEAVLRRAMQDPSPLVCATAIVGLVAGGWVADETQAALDQLLAGPSAESRRALARAIERRPSEALEPVLLELAYCPEPATQASVARAMGRMPRPRFLPALLGMLAPHAARRAARDALLEHGEEGLRFLGEALADTTLPHELRRHIPRSVSRFPAEQAAPLLLARLPVEEDGMVGFRILRGLGRLAAGHPELPLDDDVLRGATERTLRSALRLAHWRRTLEAGALEQPARATRGHELLLTLLRDKEAHALERLFRLLGLRFRHEDFERIYDGLAGRDAKLRASSRELIENLLQPPLRDAVLALADPGPGTDPLAAGLAYYRAEVLGYEQVLAVLIEQPGETLRSLAAYHVGELRLSALRERLVQLRAQETGLFVGRIFERALLRLEPGAGGAHAG